MNSLIEQKRNFDIQKNKLKHFSKDIPNSVNLPSSKTKSGLFDWFDHKVTGEQFNDFASKTQDYLISTNTHVIKIIKEFDEVYNTFDTLDKEYLNKIIASIKAAEKACETAIRNTNDIQKLLSVQGITISKLQKFKNEVENVHDVGKKWDYIQTLKSQIDSINKFNKDQKGLNDDLFRQNKNLEETVNQKIVVQGQEINKQKEDIQNTFDDFSKETISIIDNLDKNQKIKHQYLEESVNQKFVVQGQEINKQKEDIQNTFDDFSKEAISIIDNLDKNQKINHQNLEESVNQKIVVQGQEINKQKEDIQNTFDDFSKETLSKIENLEQNQQKQYQHFNSELHDTKNSLVKLQNEINTKTELFSRKIKIVYVALSLLGCVTITNIVLNILKII